MGDEGKTIFECPVTVFIGGDTRPSTPELLELVAQGVQYAGGKVVDFKLTTTPQLQYYGTFIENFSLPLQYSNQTKTNIRQIN